MPEPSEQWGSKTPIHGPIVFNFEATEILTVNDEHLAEWEEWAAHRTTMQMQPGPTRGSFSKTIAKCPGAGWDMTDVDPGF